MTPLKIIRNCWSTGILFPTSPLQDYPEKGMRSLSS